LQAVAPSAAITRPGIAPASAPSSIPTSFGCVSVLPPTDGPGNRTFTTEPGGAIVFTQPYVPALRGISGPLTCRNALHVAETVTP
jgi:hypothetical protein